MTLKEGVTQQGVRPAIWWAIGIAEMIYRLNGLKLVVTSLTDGEHKEGSLHYKGLAADLRTRNVPPELLRTIKGSLTSVLDPMGFDVILESDHIHVEYDPKLGEQWQTFVA